MSWSKSMLTAGLVSTSLILAACESTPKTKTALSNQERLSQYNWTTARIGTIYLASAATNKPNLKFSPDGRVSANDGCNVLTANYTAGTDTLVFSQMAHTQRACLGDNNQIPEQFNTALNKVTHYRVAGSTLRLMDHHGNALIELNHFNNNQTQ
jgi:heat shock protein HslJ